jgi:hypothetical protein
MISLRAAVQYISQSNLRPIVECAHSEHCIVYSTLAIVAMRLLH